jgi:hypothetical protein
MPASEHLGYLRKRLPRIAGTNAVDLRPLAPARPVLDRRVVQQRSPIVKPEKREGEKYEALAVRERLESRAHTVQRPIIERNNMVLAAVMKERKMWVNNDTGKSVEVSLNGTRFIVDQGRNEYPRSVAIAFEERKNEILKAKMIAREGQAWRYKTADDLPEPREIQDELRYVAHQDSSI